MGHLKLVKTNINCQVIHVNFSSGINRLSRKLNSNLLKSKEPKKILKPVELEPKTPRSET
jgi:hypothetical protein